MKGTTTNNKRLTDEGLETIRKNARLYGEVAEKLGVTPLSLGDILREPIRRKRLTEYSVLEVISTYTGKSIENLLTTD